VSSASSTKVKLSAFSQSYLASLGKHLMEGSASGLEAARGLGLRAVRLGLETLDLARIHEDALITLMLPHYSARTSNGMVRCAGAFFAEAITSIEETHRGAREANANLKVMIGKLSQRTGELASSNAELKLEIVQRKGVEDALRKSELTSSQLLERSRQMQEELRQLSRRLLSAQEEERKRISRELHDVIAQTLTGINVRLATLKSQSATNAKDLHRKIASTQRLVEKSVDIVHRFARDLRPAVLDDLGLIPALHSYMKAFIEQTGIRVGFTAFAGVEKLDSARRTVLYRVAQEALTNIARHAKASHAKVSIHNHSGTVCMVITDDGKGFQVEGAVFAKNRRCLGLLGMRERVEMVGGAFYMESAPGRQTTIRVEIPHPGVSPKKRPAGKSGAAPFKQP
jgi:signal transduction histidine kinase